MSPPFTKAKSIPEVPIRLFGFEIEHQGLITDSMTNIVGKQSEKFIAHFFTEYLLLIFSTLFFS